MITSKQNETFKKLLKLKKAKYRNQYQEALIFGHDLIEEALKKNKVIQIISTFPHGNHLVLSKELIDELSDFEMKEPIAAIVSIKNTPSEYKGNILMCDTIQDPRNLGALIRSAHAFGFHKIILNKASVDPYHELSMRTSKGSIFHVSLEVLPLVETIAFLKQHHYMIVASSHLKQQSQIQPKQPIVLILGNEGHGISDDLLNLTDMTLHIPTVGVDSLNVSVAGSILMYTLSEK